jgi:hypothetical protein
MPCLAPGDVAKGRRLSIVYANTAKAKKRTLHGSFCNLLTDIAEPSLERRCIVRGFGVDDRGNLPQACQ